MDQQKRPTHLVELRRTPAALTVESFFSPQSCSDGTFLLRWLCSDSLHLRVEVWAASPVLQQQNPDDNFLIELILQSDVAIRLIRPWSDTQS